MRSLAAFLHRVEELTLTLTLLGLALVAFGQVFCRYALGLSFDWFEEGGRYLGIFITFLGAGIGVKRGAHFSMDLLVTSVTPTAGKVLRSLIGLISGSCLALVAWYGFKIVLRNYAYENTSPAMQLPMYLVYLPIPLFSGVMGLRFFLSAGQAWKRPTTERGE